MDYLRSGHECVFYWTADNIAIIKHINEVFSESTHNYSEFSGHCINAEYVSLYRPERIE